MSISWLSVEFVDAAGISKVSKFTMVLVNVILEITLLFELLQLNENEFSLI